MRFPMHCFCGIILAEICYISVLQFYHTAVQEGDLLSVTTYNLNSTAISQTDSWVQELTLPGYVVVSCTV